MFKRAFERVEPLSRVEFEGYVQQIRTRYPEYGIYFGVEKLPTGVKPWAAYIRQSTEEQSKNNAVPAYLLACAEEAAKLRAYVPMALIVYDASSGANMERPALEDLLTTYVKPRRITGVIVPELSRLTRDPTHLSIFEWNLEHYQVRYWYGGGVPNGTDEESKMTRRILCEAHKIQRRSISVKSLEGRKGRVLQNNVPAGKPPTGYRIVREQTSGGRVVAAHYEVDGVYPGVELPLPLEQLQDVWELDRYAERLSPAWIIGYIFYLTAYRGISGRQIAFQLQDLGARTMFDKEWNPNLVNYVLKNTAYYGHGIYNRTHMQTNPNNPVDDITRAERKTVKRVKDEREHVTFECPPLVSEAVFNLAQENIAGHRRVRGAATERYAALLRGIIHCPECLTPMYAQRDARNGYFSYYCGVARDKEFRASSCSHRRFYSANLVDAFVLQQLQLLCTQPEVLLRRVEAEENPELPDYLRAQMEVTQDRVKKLEGQQRRTLSAWNRGDYGDDEAGEKQYVADMGTVRAALSEARAELDQAQDALSRFQSRTSDRQALYEYFVAWQAQGLQDTEQARGLLLETQAVFIPDPASRKGEGRLHLRHVQQLTPPASASGPVTMKGSSTLTSHGYTHNRRMRLTVSALAQAVPLFLPRAA